MSKKILIAKVISAFGIKGEVKIVAYCQDPLQIEKYPLFDNAGNSLKLKISNKNKSIIGNSLGNPILIVKIDSIQNRNMSEAMRGTEIFVNRQDLKETKNDEFYYVDLIDLTVLDQDSQKVGKVLNVQDFGAGGMLEIEFTSNFLKSSQGKNFEKIESFPFKNKIFPEVNLSQGFIKIDFPEFLKKPSTKTNN